MDDNTVLEKLHILELDLADELKRICTENGLKYMLIYGSMLGAVRHQGFIPWDDDIDFGMPRKDYEIFKRVCKKSLSEKFFLITDDNEKMFPFNFTKLCLKNTEVIQEFSKKSKVKQGIHIDILPIDHIADSRYLQRFQLTIYWIARSMLWLKCGYGIENRNRVRNKIVKMVSMLFPVSFLKYIKRKSITFFENKNTKSIVVADTPYNLKKQVMPSKWVKTLQVYAFEGREYLGIKDYDRYLRYIYNDYMKYPPLEERNHHSRMDVDFGPYK